MVGFNTMVDDVKAVAYACELANLYSMDTISLGVVIAWAMECYEKGVITKKDTYGLDLTWGNAEAMVELVRKIGTRADQVVDVFYVRDFDGQKIDSADQVTAVKTAILEVLSGDGHTKPF